MKQIPSAFPVSDGAWASGNEGLSKRELIAAMVLQGFAADPSMATVEELDEITGCAVRWADSLLRQLAKPEARDDSGR